MKRIVYGVMAALCAAGCTDRTDDFEAKRAALLAKPRTVITDNDGNDIVYYDRDRPVTEEAFIGSRIGFVAKTRAETMVYCPECYVPGSDETWDFYASLKFTDDGRVYMDRVVAVGPNPR